MIVGIGTDILKISRIKSAYSKYGDKFAERILSPSELIIFNDKQASISYLAKRFSAKESASKALGTGIGSISWHDFETQNNDSGAPILILTGKAKEKMNQMGASQTFLSLSDESDHVVSFVILS